MISIVSMDALALRRVKMVKDTFGTKKDKYTSAFFALYYYLIVFNNLSPYAIIRHYTIIKFDRFAMLYCYLAYTFIWQSRVGLSNSQYATKLRCVFNKVLLLNHLYS